MSRILANTKVQLRHTALWAEQPLEFWTFFGQTVTVGLPRPQPVNYFNKSSVCLCYNDEYTYIVYIRFSREP